MVAALKDSECRVPVQLARRMALVLILECSSSPTESYVRRSLKKDHMLAQSRSDTARYQEDACCSVIWNLRFVRSSTLTHFHPCLILPEYTEIGSSLTQQHSKNLSSTLHSPSYSTTPPASSSQSLNTDWEAPPPTLWGVVYLLRRNGGKSRRTGYSYENEISFAHHPVAALNIQAL